MTEPLERFLRGIPVLANVPGGFDTATAPPEPRDLFAQWIVHALELGVREPHAMTVSTCGADGVPDARVLILKDLDDEAWWFATSSAGAIGRQLADRDAAALTFYWPLAGRQIRVRGHVVRAPAERSDRDFAARSVEARALTLASDERQRLPNEMSWDTALARARASLESGAAVRSTSWTLYGVVAGTIEFFEAHASRTHLRLVYRRTAAGWSAEPIVRS